MTAEGTGEYQALLTEVARGMGAIARDAAREIHDSIPWSAEAWDAIGAGVESWCR